MCAVYEVEREAGQDIFTDPPSNPLSDHRFAVDTRNPEECLKCRISALCQIAYHAHVVQARQSRTCVFPLTISGSTARIMRWDRSGVLVTQAFDYKSDPKMTIEFVWRFTNADRSQQGFDLTALPVGSEGDRDSFLNSIKSHVCLQLSLDPKVPGNDLNEEVN